VPRAGQPGGLQYVLHPGLVTEVQRRIGAQPRHAEKFASPGQRDLQLLQRAQHSLRRPQLPGELARGMRDLRRIEAVVDPIVSGQGGTQARGQLVGRILADQAQIHAAQSGRAGDEPERRFQEERGDENDMHVHGRIAHHYSRPSAIDFWHWCGGGFGS
jgi:hypothetical protein